MALTVGAQAPDFTARAVVAGRFEDFRLHAHIGARPLVLEFFPFAFSGVCTAQLCDLRDAAPALARLDASVVACSADSVFALREYAARLGFPYPLVSDTERAGIRAFGVGYEEPFYGARGVAKRAVFVIDTGHVVRHAWVTEDAEARPDVADLQRVLAALA